MGLIADAKQVRIVVDSRPDEADGKPGDGQRDRLKHTERAFREGEG